MIEVHNGQSSHPVEPARLEQAARAVLRGEGITAGALSIAVVDDPTIRRLHRQYLDQDDATDVLSFVLEQRPGMLEGEVIVSADTAARAAADAGWDLMSELVLYVVHGTLHLVGFDDRADADRKVMRAREARYLSGLGIAIPPAAVDAGARYVVKGDSAS